MRTRTRHAYAYAVALCVTVGVACAQEAGDDATDDDYAEAMEREHAGDAPVASDAAGDAEVEVVGEPVVYASVDGQEVTGYLARPAGGEDPLPGLIVIQEWWGLNDHIRSMAEKLAGEGYLALAVDLYQGEVAENRDQASTLMRQAMNRSASLEDNLRQAHDFLRAQGAPTVGSIGWCFGGGWSLRTALTLGDDLDAAVIYYGRLVTDTDELEAVSASILGIFGGLDQGIPVESVREFEAALEALEHPASIHVYPDADHAFANPSGTRYNAEAAEDAWAKTVAFLAEHLRDVG